MTSLSAGSLVRDLIINSGVVANKVYPILVDKATLPYICYRRTGMRQTPTKSGFHGSDVVTMEVSCFAKTYEKSLTMAEAVRQALDGKSFTNGTTTINGCTLTDSEENWESDAYVQVLTFEIRV